MIKKTALLLLLVIFQLSAYAQRTYQVDVKKSKILWNNGKTMGGHFGYILFKTGTLNYSAAGQPVNGAFYMDMNNMKSTDNADAAKNEKVNKELRKSGYFDIDHYPLSTMVIRQITKAPNIPMYIVKGELTIKGITKPIDLMAEIKEKGHTLVIKSELSVDRLKWNIDMQPDPNGYSFLATMKSKVIAAEINVSLNLVMVETTVK